MRLFSVRFAVLLGLFGLVFSFSTPSMAQVSIELGGSAADLKRRLTANGYTEIVIIKQKFVATTVEACLGKVRYRMKILITGQTKSRDKIGNCRTEINIDQARNLLLKQGYDRIDIEPRRNKFVAVACLNRARLRVSVDRFGDVRQERRLGKCRPTGLTPTDVKADLEQQGYSRIRFIDRQLPRYVAEACLGLTRVELVISGDGEIRRENEIGSCRRAIDPRELTDILKRNGFNRVKVIDDQLPRYVVEACRNNKLQEVTLNRFGRIVDQYQLGRCANQMNRAQFEKFLKKQDVSRTKIISQNNGIYIVKLCEAENQLNVTYNNFGEVLGQKRVGTCRSRSVAEISDALARRGNRNTRFYAEGCRNGKRIRVEFNRIGDPVGRKRLGSC